VLRTFSIFTATAELGGQTYGAGAAGAARAVALAGAGGAGANSTRVSSWPSRYAPPSPPTAGAGTPTPTEQIRKPTRET
jgi:hypothetical protein